MKCAFIASFYGPYYSNFVAAMISFDKKMKSEGNTVFYILPKEAENFEWMSTFKKQNSDIYFLEYKPYSFNNLLALKKIFKEENVDLIYSHMCGWDFTARFAMPKLPLVWHMHMNVNVKNKVKHIKNIIKFKFIGFGKTYHIAVSEPVTTAINSLKPRNKCITVENAIDFLRISKKSNNIVDSDAKNILIFGWQPIVKGLDITLDACEKLIAEGKNIKLLVSAQEKTYDYMTERYDTTPNWLELLEPTSDVSSLYNRADIMVSASRSEGFSFALAEAIYSGLITVVSDIPGTSWSSEFAARYEFKSGDSDSLKIALTKACSHNITAHEQQNNQQILEQKYSMDVWADAIYNELNLIINNEK